MSPPIPRMVGAPTTRPEAPAASTSVPHPSEPMWPVRPPLPSFRVHVSLVASRQLSRLPAEVADRVRKELHAEADRASRGGRAPEAWRGPLALALRLRVDAHVLHCDVDRAQAVLTLREVEPAP